MTYVMDAPVIAKVPSSIFDPDRLKHDETRNETIVRNRFWRKVRRTMGKVPFLDEALAAYYCTRDSQTPLYAKAILLGALAYFVVPTDMIPDFIAGLGYGDDATVLVAAISALRNHIKPEHRTAAQVKLAELRDETGVAEPASPTP